MAIDMTCWLAAWLAAVCGAFVVLATCFLQHSCNVNFQWLPSISPSWCFWLELCYSQLVLCHLLVGEELCICSPSQVRLAPHGSGHVSMCNNTS